jgi:hypothetical protein
MKASVRGGGAMACRDEVLAAFERLERRHGRTAFELAEVVQEVQGVGTAYRESTIRTHVSSRMCVDAPDHHGTVYADLDRVGRGLYRRRGGS